MTMTLERTGWVLGDEEEISSLDDALTSQHTPAREVPDATLREVLATFDATFTEPMGAMRLLWSEKFSIPVSTAGYAGGWASALRLADRVPTALVSCWAWTALRQLVVTVSPGDHSLGNLDVEADSVGDRNPGEVIEWLMSELGAGRRDICSAAGISRSASYNWTKPGGSRPRVSSEGRLWALVQFCQDLSELLDIPPREWLLADKRRYQRFLHGHFDELLESLREVIREPEESSTRTQLFQVGGDRLDSDDEPPALRRGARQVTQARPAMPAGRQRG
jgi:hypothetical protein